MLMEIGLIFISLMIAPHVEDDPWACTVAGAMNGQENLPSRRHALDFHFGAHENRHTPVSSALRHCLRLRFGIKVNQNFVCSSRRITDWLFVICIGDSPGRKTFSHPVLNHTTHLDIINIVFIPTAATTATTAVTIVTTIVSTNDPIFVTFTHNIHYLRHKSKHHSSPLLLKFLHFLFVFNDLFPQHQLHHPCIVVVVVVCLHHRHINYLPVGFHLSLAACSSPQSFQGPTFQSSHTTNPSPSHLRPLSIPSPYSSIISITVQT